jgi:response regulator RpfG family c-di-GMP phosphodiesterase
MKLHRVLFVDDEPHVLDSIQRTLRGHFDVSTAVGAELGMAMIRASDPFAVVVSDLRMPGTDGIRFLTSVRRASPDSVRILLTGHADVEGAIKAVNDGQVFRFLRKPCSPMTLNRALEAAAQQYELVTAERELLEGTLQGTIHALADVLALVSPLAFARAVRVKEYVGGFAERFGIPNRWQFEVAALLSQIGAASIPRETADKLYFGRPLTDEESELARAIPATAANVVAHIPRLEGVREILRHQHRNFKADVPGAEGPWELDIPLGSRLLRVAFDLDLLLTQGLPARAAIESMMASESTYDPDVLKDFLQWQGYEAVPKRTRELQLCDLQTGMVLAVDVVTAQGVLLIARGQAVTRRVKNLIEDYWVDQPINGPVRVYIAHEEPAEV